MIIVFPMVGLSQRFHSAGFEKPKFMLPAFDLYLFDFAVQSFEAYFYREKFLFVTRDDPDHRAFVDQRCQALGVQSYQIVSLEASTRGQAETVALGLRAAGIENSDPITIFNIDTYRRHFRFPEEQCDGYLEVFEGEGTHWSFAQTEKIPIGSFGQPRKNEFLIYAPMDIWISLRRIFFDPV